jgi:hypothetical protein
MKNFRTMPLTVLLMTSLMPCWFGVFAYGGQLRCLEMGLKTPPPSLKWLNDLFQIEGGHKQFVVPNEQNTEDFVPHLANHPGGIYLSVGTERGLMGAVKSRSGALLWVDRESHIKAYNLSTRGLLALAKIGDVDDYLELRLHASEETIHARVEKALKERQVSTEILLPLLSPNFFPWWTEVVRKNSAWSGFDRDLDKADIFAMANYLRDPKELAYAQNLILSNKVYILEADLAEIEVISDQLKSIQQQHGFYLHFLDFSNAWEEGYLGHAKSVDLIRALSNATLNSNHFKVLASIIDYNRPNNGNTNSRWRFTSKEVTAGSNTDAEIWNHFRLLAQIGQFKHNPIEFRNSRLSNDW